MSIRFDGQAAIVTGAGRGLGREIATRLAGRGAKVLVNDYGGDASTLKAGSPDIAEAAAQAIRDAGGEAMADATRVGTGASAAAIVDHAIAAFGRVDILVNNAGGAVVGNVDAFDDAAIEGVLQTNFLGPYMLLRRAWPHMRAQGYGRVVNILSGAMFGLGQRAPYAAGKAGLMGLTAEAALEGQGIGVFVNGACPVAYTRLAKGGPQEIADWLKQYYPPALAAEAIVFLCSRENQANGEIFDVGGGRVTRYAVFQNSGVYDGELTCESLAERFGEVRDLKDARPLHETKRDRPLPDAGLGNRGGKS
jgi:NAD(P)-dependent dehydrogenase (short-subunit alcohol dehydrogenase family)